MKEWFNHLISELSIELADAIIILSKVLMLGTGFTFIAIWILLLLVVAGAVMAGFILEEKAKAERRKNDVR